MRFLIIVLFLSEKLSSTVITSILGCVINSNLNIEHIQIKKLIPFWTLRNSICTTQTQTVLFCMFVRTHSEQTVMAE